jgi:hypothetical protein
MPLQLADFHYVVSTLSSVPFPVTDMMIHRDERMFELYLLYVTQIHLPLTVCAYFHSQT